MKKYVFFVILMLVPFVGCKTSKEQLLKKDSLTEREIKTDVTLKALETKYQQYYDSLANEKVSRLMEFYTKETQANVRKVEYDTSHPIDTVTGRSPIKSETFIDYTSKERKYTEQIEVLKENLIRTINQRDSLQTLVRDLSVQNVKETEKVEMKTKQGLSGWQNFQIWTGRILFIGLIIIFAIRFLIKKFK